MATIDERLRTSEGQIAVLMKDIAEQKKFRRKFDAIISLAVAKTDNGRVSLRDNGDK